MSSLQECSCCSNKLPHTKEYFTGSIERREGWLGKQCRACRRIKCRDYMRRNKSKYKERDRRYYNSKERKQYRKTEVAKYKAYLRSMKYKYGVTESCIRSLQDTQKGCCAICRGSLVDISIDHCHTTGKVRGLLCQPCNVLIGMANDNKETLQNAIQYLEDSN